MATKYKGYREWVGLVSQSSTNAPTATVLRNTLYGTPAFSYVGPGKYYLTLTGAFTGGKTNAYSSINTSDATKEIAIYRTGDNAIRFESYSSGAYANDVMSSSFVWIRVYDTVGAFKRLDNIHEAFMSITQTSTNNPVIINLINPIYSSVALTRSGVGTYAWTWGGTTPDYRHQAICRDVFGSICFAEKVSGDLTTYSRGVGEVDDALSITNLSPRVYYYGAFPRYQGYKYYAARITQSSTNAPTVVELYNTLGETPTFGYSAVGVYTCTTSGNVFTTAKTVAMISPMNKLASDIVRSVAHTSQTVVTIYTTTYGGAASNANLYGNLFEIYVFE